MKPEYFDEAIWLKNRDEYVKRIHNEYLNRHPEFQRLEFPKNYYFKILHDRMSIHWAFIIKESNKYIIYFIDVNGEAFDKLEYNNLKVAQRLLRKNKFFFTTNKKCPYEPVKPIFVNLSYGKKSAPYSKGNLWIPQERFKKTQALKIKTKFKDGVQNNLKESLRGLIYVFIMEILLIFIIWLYVFKIN